MESFLCFVEEGHVGLKVLKAQRVIHMEYADVVRLKRLAPEHVFVPVMAETFIERILQHYFSAHYEIGCVEISVGMRLPDCVVSILAVLPLGDVSQIV